MFFKRNNTEGYDNDWNGSDLPPNSWYLQHLMILITIVAAVIGVAWGFYGRGIAEKVITAILQPVGLIWACLLFVVYFSFLLRHISFLVVSALGWIVLTLAGNQYFSNWLISTLESRYYHKNLEQLEVAEYGLLLGGSTATAPNLRQQLNQSGDRIAVAAELYHAGRIKTIICSGSNSVALDSSQTPSDQAISILKRLQVPDSNLLQLKGANTYQEIENLKTWIDRKKESGQDPGRIAVISSAWHLPRVQRLARSRDLQISPVPANFLSTKIRPSANAIVPGAYQLLVSSQAIKEYLAGLVSR